MADKECNIAYFCPSISWGGLEMNQLNNAKWMQNRNHKVLIFVQKDSRTHQEAIQLGLRVDFVLKHYKYYDFINGFRLYKKIKKHQITHLIVRDPKDMSVCALAKSFCLNKVYLAYFMEMQIGIPKRDVLHTIRFRKFDLWSCPLNYLQQQVFDLTRFPASRTIVIPSGLELKRFSTAVNSTDSKIKLELDAHKKYIGLIGRLDPQKGQYFLLEAFNLIKDEIDYEIVFLGEPTHGEHADYPSKLKYFAKENNFEFRVHYRPFRKDTETFYSAMELIVMATKSETFGMVTIEAMASGCKIIGSKCGGTLEILTEGDIGLLFDAENKYDLAHKIKEAIHQNHFDKDKVLEASKRFDFQKIGEQVETTLGLK